MRKSYFKIVLIMSDKDNAINHTERVLKNFQCSIFFCDKDFQSSCKLCIGLGFVIVFVFLVPHIKLVYLAFFILKQNIFKPL